MDNYIIIHGSYGNPYKNWIPYLKKKLSIRKLNCIIPSFPTPHNQNYNSWETVLLAYFKVGYITENTTIITHSLGSIFVVKFLIENKIKVKRIITVAGFNKIKYDEDNSLYDSFYMEDNELNKIVDLCEDIYCFYSDNDPYVNIDKAMQFAKLINGKGILIKNAGHFNEKSGYSEFKELLKFI